MDIWGEPASVDLHSAVDAESKRLVESQDIRLAWNDDHIRASFMQLFAEISKTTLSDPAPWSGHDDYYQVIDAKSRRAHEYFNKTLTERLGDAISLCMLEAIWHANVEASEYAPADRRAMFERSVLAPFIKKFNKHPFIQKGEAESDSQSIESPTAHSIGAMVHEAIPVHVYDLDVVQQLFGRLFKAKLAKYEEVTEKRIHDLARESAGFLWNNLSGAFLMSAQVVSYCAAIASLQIAREKSGNPVGREGLPNKEKEIGEVGLLIFREWLESLPIQYPGGGRKIEWTSQVLRKAIEEAITVIPLKLRTYPSIAKKISKLQELEKPLTSSRLRGLVSERGLKEWWEQTVTGRKYRKSKKRS